MLSLSKAFVTPFYPMKQIVALTASSAGSAHARLAAEALRAVATQAGHGFKAEIADATGVDELDRVIADVVAGQRPRG